MCTVPGVYYLVLYPEFSVFLLYLECTLYCTYCNVCVLYLECTGDYEGWYGFDDGRRGDLELLLLHLQLVAADVAQLTQAGSYIQLAHLSVTIF